MSNNMKVLIVGAGLMAKEYCKVLSAMHYEVVVVGRGKNSANAFMDDMGIPVQCGGIEKNIGLIGEIPLYAIVAVGVDFLADVVKVLLEKGIKNILVEKPGGIDQREIEEIAKLSKDKEANVYVGYNRRFYASTERALEIINKDGGITSFSFEFTEWGHEIVNTKHSVKVKDNWFLANSSHVADLAFFLGGFPEEIHSYVKGSLVWHKNGCIYAGAGISEKGALFSYQANWDAPGRWSVEILTKKHRLYFKPMEKLQIQEKGSVIVKHVDINDQLDIEYKPGLYRQVESFLKNIDDGKKITIEEQLSHMKWYEKIESIAN